MKRGAEQYNLKADVALIAISKRKTALNDRNRTVFCCKIQRGTLVWEI